MSRRFLVTGATGNIGGKLAHRLIALGHRPYTLVRDSQSPRAKELERLGAQLIMGDLDEARSIQLAFDGIDSAFLITANGQAQLNQELTFIDAAVRAKVSRIVKISALRPDPCSLVAVFRDHATAEAHVRATGIPYSIINPNFFMSNIPLMFLEMARSSGTIVAPLKEGRVACVDPYDVADVAASCLLDTGSFSVTLTPTGPSAISFHDIAALLANRLGTPVRYVDIPVESFEAEMIEAGLPRPMAKDYSALFAELAGGIAEQVTRDVEQTLLRPPTSLRHYLAEHLDSFIS